MPTQIKPLRFREAVFCCLPDISNNGPKGRRTGPGLRKPRHVHLPRRLPGGRRIFVRPFEAGLRRERNLHQLRGCRHRLPLRTRHIGSVFHGRTSIKQQQANLAAVSGPCQGAGIFTTKNLRKFWFTGNRIPQVFSFYGAK